MGILTCPRCKAKTNANSIQDGRKRLNHAIGLYINKPCGDGVAELLFTQTDQEKSKKPKKTSKIDSVFK